MFAESLDLWKDLQLKLHGKSWETPDWNLTTHQNRIVRIGIICLDFSEIDGDSALSEFG